MYVAGDIPCPIIGVGEEHRAVICSFSTGDDGRAGGRGWEEDGGECEMEEEEGEGEEEEIEVVRMVARVRP